MKNRTVLALLIIFIGAGLAVAFGGSGAGANFDFLKDEDRTVLQERFTKEIYPLMKRGDKNGCVGCHNGKIVSALKMSGDAQKDFRMLVKEGFFIPSDAGSLHTRIISKDRKKRMPPPGKGDPWTMEESELLRKFVADVDQKQQKKPK